MQWWPLSLIKAPDIWRLKAWELLDTRGILAGDPQAPQIAKVYLYNAMLRNSPSQLDVWVDDASYDVVANSSEVAAQEAVQAYHFLKQELEKDNLNWEAMRNVCRFHRWQTPKIERNVAKKRYDETQSAQA